jgi:chromatin segregation and condensation protein Rec8/ScpA/Scc1 (kleisin family)
MIGVFCALLELCRRRMITVAQDAPCTEITISLADLQQPEQVSPAGELIEVAA